MEKQLCKTCNREYIPITAQEYNEITKEWESQDTGECDNCIKDKEDD